MEVIEAVSEFVNNTTHVFQVIFHIMATALAVVGFKRFKFVDNDRFNELKKEVKHLDACFDEIKKKVSDMDVKLDRLLERGKSVNDLGI